MLLSSHFKSNKRNQDKLIEIMYCYQKWKRYLSWSHILYAKKLRYFDLFLTLNAFYYLQTYFFDYILEISSLFFNQTSMRRQIGQKLKDPSKWRHIITSWRHYVRNNDVVINILSCKVSTLFLSKDMITKSLQFELRGFKYVQ